MQCNNDKRMSSQLLRNILIQRILSFYFCVLLKTPKTDRDVTKLIVVYLVVSSSKWDKTSYLPALSSCVSCAVAYCWVIYWEKENFPIDIVVWNTISDDLFILVTPYNKDVWDLGTFHRLFLFLHFIFPNGIYVNVPALLCVALDHPLWIIVWCTCCQSSGW